MGNNQLDLPPIAESAAEAVRHYPAGADIGTFWSVAAYKQLGRTPAPNVFQFHTIEALDNGCLLTGSKIIGSHSRGRLKGIPKWDKKTPVRVAVTQEQRDAAAKEYSARTGLCSGCLGSGLICAGWSKEHGTSYRDCDECNGTGAKP